MLIFHVDFHHIQDGPPGSLASRGPLLIRVNRVEDEVVNRVEEWACRLMTVQVVPLWITKAPQVHQEQSLDHLVHQVPFQREAFQECPPRPPSISLGEVGHHIHGILGNLGHKVVIDRDNWVPLGSVVKSDGLALVILQHIPSSFHGSTLTYLGTGFTTSDFIFSSR